jgi:hypothetical protein
VFLIQVSEQQWDDAVLMCSCGQIVPVHVLLEQRLDSCFSCESTLSRAQSSSSPNSTPWLGTDNGIVTAARGSCMVGDDSAVLPSSLG